MENTVIAKDDNGRSSPANEQRDYCFCSSWDGDGEIYNRDNNVVWKFQTTGFKKRSAELGMARPPIFVFCDASGKDLATISREKRLPLAQFAVAQNGLLACTIWQRSIWFTKYEFELDKKSKWKLCMPMFSVSGKAVSEDGVEILVQARTRKQWYVRIGTGFDSPPMMATLAFVIRKKLQCT